MCCLQISTFLFTSTVEIPPSFITPSKTILQATNEPSDIFSTNTFSFTEIPDSTQALPYDNIITSLTTSLNSTWWDKQLI